MKYFVQFLLLPILMLLSCNKAEPDECTDCIGAFECKVNGETWKPNCDSGTILWGCSAIDCQYYTEDGALILRVENERNNDRLLFSTFATDTGSVEILYSSREYKNLSRGNCASYDMIKSLPHNITILSLDTISYIVEGTFDFSVLGRCDQDTIHITDGYFHLGYRF